MATVTRAQKIRLGMFLATALTVLIGGLVMLVGRTMLTDQDTYLIRFATPAVSFSGLEVGSSVKYSGITIGQVRFLRVATDDVGVIEVGIAVGKGTPIAEDSVARLEMLGITGLKYVELSRGSSGARIREPGEVILAGESLIDELSARAGSIAERLDDLLTGFQEMAGEQTSDNVQRIIGETADLLSESRPLIHDVLSNVNDLTLDLGRVASGGVSVVSRTDDLMATLNEVGDSLQELLAPEGRFMEAMGKTESLVQRLDMIIIRSESDLDVAMRHLRDATANLNDFSLALRDDPRILLGGRDSGERNPGRRGRER